MPSSSTHPAPASLSPPAFNLAQAESLRRMGTQVPAAFQEFPLLQSLVAPLLCLITHRR